VKQPRVAASVTPYKYHYVFSLGKEIARLDTDVQLSKDALDKVFASLKENYEAGNKYFQEYMADRVAEHFK
jgi:hypothetical protein